MLGILVAWCQLTALFKVSDRSMKPESQAVLALSAVRGGCGTLAAPWHAGKE